MKKKANRLSLFQTAAACLAAAAVFFLAFITVYSSDDFWYSTFLDDGLGNYVELMKLHYKTFNGRNLVHIFATLILSVGNWLFAAVAAANAATFPLIGRKLLGDGGPLPQTALFFLCGFLLMPLPMMVQGALWISAYCNYVIPTLLVVCELLVIKRLLTEDTVRWYALAGGVLLAFLCGATTEQGGILSCAACLAAVLGCLLWKPSRLPRSALFLSACVLGLRTIFLSPATRTRLELETGGTQNNPFVPLWRGLVSQSELVSELFAALVLFAVLGLCLGASYGRLTGRKGAAAAMALLPALCVAGMALSARAAAFCYAALLASLLAAAALFWFTGKKETGVLLALTVLSVLVMAYTRSSGYRSFVPLYLLLLLVVSHELCGLLAGSRRGLRYAGTAVLVLLTVVSLAAHIPHYWANYRLDRANRESARLARETGELYYSIDYDMDYTWKKPFSDSYFLTTWLQSEGLSNEACRVYFYSRSLPVVYVNGERAASPAVPGGDEGYLLAVRDVLEPLGGTLVWQPASGTEITFRGGTYQLLHHGSRMELRWTGAQGEPQRLITGGAADYYAACLPASAFQEVWGLVVTQRSTDSEIRIDVMDPAQVDKIISSMSSGSTDDPCHLPLSGGAL